MTNGGRGVKWSRMKGSVARKNQGHFDGRTSKNEKGHLTYKGHPAMKRQVAWEMRLRYATWPKDVPLDNMGSSGHKGPQDHLWQSDHKRSFGRAVETRSPGHKRGVTLGSSSPAGQVEVNNLAHLPPRGLAR